MTTKRSMTYYLVQRRGETLYVPEGGGRPLTAEEYGAELERFYAEAAAAAPKAAPVQAPLPTTTPVGQHRTASAPEGPAVTRVSPEEACRRAAVETLSSASSNPAADAALLQQALADATVTPQVFAERLLAAERARAEAAEREVEQAAARIVAAGCRSA